MQSIETELWKTLIPPNWEVEESEDVDDDEQALSFFDPGGVGTLEISCSAKEDGLVDEDDLEYFAADLIEDELEYRRVRYGNLAGILFEYDDEDEAHRKEWFFACDDLFFYITWSRPLEDGENEEETVHDILRSIVPIY